MSGAELCANDLAEDRPAGWSRGGETRMSYVTAVVSAICAMVLGDAAVWT